MRIDLNASVTWESLQGGVRSFVDWWASELSALAPDSLRRAIAPLLRRYSLVIDDGGWRLSCGDQGSVEIHLDPHAPDAELRDLVARIEPRALKERVEVEI